MPHVVFETICFLTCNGFEHQGALSWYEGYVMGILESEGFNTLSSMAKVCLLHFVVCAWRVECQDETALYFEMIRKKHGCGQDLTVDPEIFTQIAKMRLDSKQTADSGSRVQLGVYPMWSSKV